MGLSEEQIQRYSRHILLSDVGGVGQSRLLDATVAVEIGAGRDANVVALTYLAAAGVGRILVTGDTAGPVTDAELPGGILYAAEDLGTPRLAAIARRVAALNPDVTIAERQPGHEATVVDAGASRDPVDAMIAGGAAALDAITRLARPE